MLHLTPTRQDTPSRILEIRGGRAERSAIVIQVHGDGREEVLAEADLRLAPIHPVHFIAPNQADSFTLTAAPITPGSSGVARVVLHDQSGAQLALITKDHTRSYLRTTFDINTPHDRLQVVEANLLLAALHRASMVFWSLQWFVPERSRFAIRLDGARVGSARRIRRAYRCGTSTQLDWRVAAVIPLVVETMLNQRNHQRWALDRRYLAAVREHERQPISTR
jgi:hypothetical protein